MKRAVVLVVAATWVSVGAANAGVNCDQVKKYLKDGADTPGRRRYDGDPIDDVKKCQARRRCRSSGGGQRRARTGRCVGRTGRLQGH